MIEQFIGNLSVVLIIKNSALFVKDIYKYFSDEKTMFWKTTIEETTTLSKKLYGEHLKKLKLFLENKENKQSMEEYFESCSPFELEEIMKKYIYLIASNNGLNKENSKEFSRIFFEYFCILIKEKDKKFYEKLLINKKLNKILKQNDIKYKTILQEENILKNNTSVPFKKINLDFFDYEDKEFRKYFKEKIIKNEHAIYIQGNSKEETFYHILLELKRLNLSNKTVYIIESKDNWDKCEDKIKNNIMIPNFYSDDILPISNNINIFIFGKYNPYKKSNLIISKNRLMSNLEKKLIQFLDNKDSNYSYKLINKTNGIFSSLKRELFEGISKHKWSKLITTENKKYIITGLLLGSWADKDKENISTLFKIEYSEFITHLSKFINMDDPLFIKIETNSTKYKLANPEEAWSYLAQEISNENWEIYSKKVIKIISDVDNLYINKADQKIICEEPNDRKYSHLFKQSLLINMIIFKNENIFFFDYNKVVKQIFENIITNKQINSTSKWAYISEHILLLCEISPKIVIEFFNRSLKNDNGLLDVFHLAKNYNTFGKNYYIHFLWAIEYLLQYDESQIKSINFLLKINDLNLKYNTLNSPSSTLRHIFCYWMDYSFLDINDIKILAKDIIKKYKNGWNIIFNELPKENGDYLDEEIAKPIYSNNVKNRIKISINDSNNLAQFYIELCIENANNTERWLKLLDYLPFKYYGLFEKTISLLDNFIKRSDDKSKEKIKSKLREILYEHRFFCNNKLNNEQIKKLNNLFNSVNFEEDLFNYSYLFKKYQNFPLLAPISINDEDYYTQNKIKTTNLITKELIKLKSEYKEKNSFIKLLKLNLIEDYNLFGKYLAIIFSENNYNENICKTFLEINNLDFNSKAEILFSYSEQIYRKNNGKELYKIIQLIEKISLNQNFLKNIIFIFKNPNDFKLINKLNLSLQKKYWKNVRIINFYPESNFSSENINYIIEKYIKFGNGNIYEFLEDNRDLYSGENYLEFLKKIQKNNNINLKNTFIPDFYIKKIFYKIYEFYKNNIDKYSDIATIELYYRELLPWNKLKCFSYLLKKEPNYYAEMINLLYKHNNDENNTPKDDAFLNNLGHFFYKIKFCPCTNEKNDIDEDELRKWIEQFEKLLTKQNQQNLFSLFLGKLFAYSPKGSKDNFEPQKTIRNIVEEIFENRELEEIEIFKRNYIATTLNARGIFSPTAGKKEKSLANKYKNNAENIKFYTITSEIYQELYSHYAGFSKIERTKEEIPSEF